MCLLMNALGSHVQDTCCGWIVTVDHMLPYLVKIIDITNSLLTLSHLIINKHTE